MPPPRLLPATLLLLIQLLPPILSVAIDNSVAAPPDVECLDDRIRVWVHTRKYFAGRIYAKNRAEYPACIQGGYAPLKTQKPHFEVTFGQCGMTSLRSAFHVKCFFEEANRGLTAELGVSMIPTTEVGAHHGIPGCTYSIHQGTIQEVDRGILGPPIQFARVGEKILHRWECADQMFGVLINKCYVTDGFGSRAEVVDEKGCPLDPILITGIRYAANLTVAFAESHVFKFADKPGVWFFCQIQMCMKGGGMCFGITPPQCSGNLVTTGAGYQPPPGPGTGYHNPANDVGPAQGANNNYLPPPTGGQAYPRHAANNDIEDEYWGGGTEDEHPIDLVFEHDDVVGTALEGVPTPALSHSHSGLQEPDDPLHLDERPETGLDTNRVDMPNLPPSVIGRGGREKRPFPKDPVLLDSQDLKFLGSRGGRMQDTVVSPVSLEDTDGQITRQPNPKFPVPKVVMPMPSMGAGAQMVRPSVVVPFPPGFDADSFNDTDLMQELNGGLIVYDVDEEPPMFSTRSKSDFAQTLSGNETSTSTVSVAADCPLTGKGLLILISVLGGLCGTLGLVLWITCLRLNKLRNLSAKGTGSVSMSETGEPDPLSTVASMYRKAKRQASESRSRSYSRHDDRHRSTSRHHSRHHR